ncbi:hypothetical protein KMW28_23960 [Flammeovirga yaeyamensis]|uniref:TonB C-terminal domain-containing protein n=1 Tax=Flammeovirga yaeyamensis TaxID=367791 RepID=A0AAX1NFP1_9BACT|nr:hypothetical protein [Flammeovirga yaeyamensis]MBB3696565.1 hypothetical protein [Flammeovirga yaeyamensis]NMF33243.1 hypothetical protein [Flammeovirga yaeyamensis]QWG05478.1 hypothetical protein KMW28_23960 [Flammeovirga yaeyamensis]
MNRIVLLFLISNTFYFKVLGCECSTETLEKEINETSVIFIGKAITVSTEDGYENRTTFEVLETLKGEFKNEMTVVSESYSSSCGYSFDIDSLYIVFGRFNSLGEYKIRTNLCTRTGHISRSTDLIRKLKKLGNEINSINLIDTHILYNEIWKDEKFIWTDEYSELLLSNSEELDLIESSLTYCEPDSTFLQNKIDSLKWINRKNKIIVGFEVNQFGETSNFFVFPNRNTNKHCQEIAIQFVKTLKPWKPATIKGIKVRSNGYYEVDFSKCKSR